MDFIGSIARVEREFSTNTPLVTLRLENGAVSELNEYFNGALDVSIKKHREKRSLDSNSYSWILMQKIAEKLHTTKEEVYLQMLQRYSRSFTHIIVKEKAIPKLKEQYRTVIDLGEITVGNMTGHQLQVYFGSSTFDTKEMSIFIDGIVSECKELGIETLPPAEIERMEKAWNQ